MIYLDSEDPYWYQPREPSKPIVTKPIKKDNSIITTKLIIIMAAVAICKVAILLML